MIQRIHQSAKQSIRRICSVLNYSRSSYYNAQKETQRQQEDRCLGEEIERVFRAHKRRYGYRRIAQELADEGIVCSGERVRRLMKSRGLIALQPKTYVPQTSDGRADAPSPNLVAQEGIAQEPYQTYVGDITHIPIAGGWAYLAIVMDLHTRKIVGWKLDDNMRASLVTEALQNAYKSHPTKSGAMFHSDRGSQYGSRLFRSLLKKN